MLFAVDIGNSHTVSGLFQKGQLIHSWRLQSHQDRTADGSPSLQAQPIHGGQGIGLLVQRPHRDAHRRATEDRAHQPIRVTIRCLFHVSDRPPVSEL